MSEIDVQDKFYLELEYVGSVCARPCSIEHFAEKHRTHQTVLHQPSRRIFCVCLSSRAVIWDRGRGVKELVQEMNRCIWQNQTDESRVVNGIWFLSWKRMLQCFPRCQRRMPKNVLALESTMASYSFMPIVWFSEPRLCVRVMSGGFVGVKSVTCVNFCAICAAIRSVLVLHIESWIVDENRPAK